MTDFKIGDAGEIEELREEIENNCRAHDELLGKMQERDQENINLRIGARNDCDNIELLNAAITEFREEKKAHIRRYLHAERDLRTINKQWSDTCDELAAEKAHNENHAEHISKLCEELSGVKRSRDFWEKNYRRVCKAFNTCHEHDARRKELAQLKRDFEGMRIAEGKWRGRGGRAEKEVKKLEEELVRLRSVHAKVLLARGNWKRRARRAELSIVNAKVEAVNYSERQRLFEGMQAQCTGWAQKYAQAEGEIEQLKEELAHEVASNPDYDQLKDERAYWKGQYDQKFILCHGLQQKLDAIKKAVGTTEGE